MHAEERRQAIESLAHREGRLEVAELAERFDVSTETIRRDLTDLEKRGVLRRVHGGAMPVERFRSEPAVSERASVMAAEKQRIAKAARDLVPPGGSILLDAGTTTGALASVLPADVELTVVTNALPIAMTLSARRNLTLLFVGGRVRGVTLACVDDWADQILADIQVDVTFAATNGVSVARGLSTPDVSEAAVKRAMLRAGRRVVLLADHTKVEQDHLVRFGELEDIDTLVTDDGLSDTRAETFRAAGLEVLRA